MAADSLAWELNRPRWDLFFEHISTTGDVREALEVTGFTRPQLLYQRKNNPEFLERLEASAQDYTDRLGAEARRRALEGVEEPVWYKGEEVGTVRKYSDTLLLALLKAHDPRFREKSTLALTDGEGQPLGATSDLDMARRVAFVMAKGLRSSAVDAEIVGENREEGGGGREPPAASLLPTPTQNFPDEKPEDMI